jgi:hypothetical protein
MKQANGGAYDIARVHSQGVSQSLAAPAGTSSPPRQAGLSSYRGCLSC